MLLSLALACTAEDPQTKADDATEVTDEPKGDRPGAEDADLASLMDVDLLMGHLDVLQATADEHGGTRVSQSDGYEDSATYVADTLIAAGYDVTFDRYEVATYDVEDASADGMIWGADFEVLEYSGGGTAEAKVVGVDLQLPPGPSENSSTSGCEASDFDGFPAGSIALIQRGSCTFSEKAQNAALAGASAVLVFNEGQPGRTGVVEGVLDADELSEIPVLGLSYATGAELAQTEPVLEVSVEAVLDIALEANVIAETKGGDPDRVVLVGAHLDSVAAGPGINDNGSGTALVLEAAVQWAKLGHKPKNKIRFAWWGAEEQGLVGSWYYTHDAYGEPDEAVLDELQAYLNFDMVASGNGIRAVYDGDGSHIDDGGASTGSAQIEELFLEAFDGKETAPEGMYIPTDSWWFVGNGVPTGGVFSGAFAAKSVQDAAVFGGTVGLAYDPCYHQACDDVAHVDETLFQDMAVASAHVIQELAMRDAPLQRWRPVRADPMPRVKGCHEHLHLDR